MVISIAWPSSARACFHNGCDPGADEGKDFMYTYAAPFCGPFPGEAVIDPINLVFVSAPDWTSVDAHWQDHLGSTWWWGDEDLNQATYTVDHDCVVMQRERGTAPDSSPTRLHARMLTFG
jgi:hypothetical protein